jgi:hypothetical protein
MMNSGKILSGSPCLGSWVNYGLGSVNENLPGFVVMLDPTGGPISGAKNWSSGYMPATYQGTILRSKGAPIIDLSTPEGTSRAMQRELLDTLRDTNADHLASRADNTDLAARINSYELAFKMQQHAPEAVDLSTETEATQKMYGLDGDWSNEAFASFNSIQEAITTTRIGMRMAIWRRITISTRVIQTNRSRHC